MHISEVDGKSSNLVDFLWTVFISAQDRTVNVHSLAVLARRIDRTHQIFFSITASKPEDAFLYLYTIIMLINDNSDKNSCYLNTNI